MRFFKLFGKHETAKCFQIHELEFFRYLFFVSASAVVFNFKRIVEFFEVFEPFVVDEFEVTNKVVAEFREGLGRVVDKFSSAPEGRERVGSGVYFEIRRQKHGHIVFKHGAKSLVINVSARKISDVNNITLTSKSFFATKIYKNKRRQDLFL